MTKQRLLPRLPKISDQSADLLKIEDEEQAVQALIVLAKTLKRAQTYHVRWRFCDRKSENKTR